PQTRKPNPQTRKPNPQTRKPNPQSPKPNPQTPNPKAQHPKPKAQPPKPKAQPPKAKAESPTQVVVSPESRSRRDILGPPNAGAEAVQNRAKMGPALHGRSLRPGRACSRAALQGYLAHEKQVISQFWLFGQ
ncbi:hypothetical protein T484DRAFT_1626823, partial [Baffinella frigidus]